MGSEGPNQPERSSVMRRLLVLSLLVTACGSPPTTPTTLTTQPAASALTAPLVTEACKPPTSAVWFDPGQLGHATITNASTCTNSFLYTVWQVSPTDATRQTLVAAQGAILAPGAVGDFTVNFPETCGAKYQRDVYIGLSDATRPYSLSDVNNYFFAALGYFQTSPACLQPPRTPTPPTPPVVPPTDVCPNLEGVQASVPEGYVLQNGVCLPCPPPPPTCGPFPFSGPTLAEVSGGAPGRLAYARSLGPPFASVVAVHPPHGGTFSGNNQSGFWFTPADSYAVVIFHQTEGGHAAHDIVYTGVQAGVPLSVPSNGGDIFYFACPEA